MAGAGYYVFFETLHGGTYVTVPSLVDMSVTEAATRLAEVGLEMGKPESMHHPSKPKSYVISQHPIAGRVVRTGRRVYPTVSLGVDQMSAPDLIHLARSDASEKIAADNFRLRSIARIPNAAARDTVIGQYPPPGSDIKSQGDIHLLLSAGLRESGDFMPDIRGMRVDEVMRVLMPFGVTVVPRQVDIPDAQPDIVLDQNPPPNALISEGQTVTYDVKPSGVAELPDTRYKTVVRHRMAEDWFAKDVRVEMIDRRGQRSAVYSKVPSYEDQARNTYVAGSAISLTISYVKEATIEIFVDDRKVASYRLQEGNDPQPIAGESAV